MCRMHYRRFMGHGSTDLPKQRQKPGPKPDPTKPRSRYAPLKTRPQRTHCPQGHPYDEENTYVSPAGARMCRTCHRDRTRETRNTGVGQGGVNAAKTHCPKGHEYTPENTYTREGRRSCRECARQNMRVQNVKRYGITPAQLAEMLDDQSGCCAACGRAFGEGVGVHHVDHDHACCAGNWSCGNCIRGLLCGSCNKAVGLLGDDPGRAMGVALYLESCAVKQDVSTC